MFSKIDLINFLGSTFLVLFITFSQLDSFAQAGDSEEVIEWYSDFETAKNVAGVTGKHLLLYFSGSDWCKPCIQLNKNILDTETFSSYAKGNFVPVKLDFPKMRKNRQSKRKVIHNEDLAEKYNPNGVFPLLVFLDQNEEMIGFSGYTDVSPNAYIVIIDKIIQK